MLIDDNKQTFVARRNLMIVATLSIIFGLEAVILDSTETFFLIPIKLGSPVSLLVILLGLIIYFTWRYWASFDGLSPYFSLKVKVNKSVAEHARFLAWQYFSESKTLDDDDPYYSIHHLGGNRLESFFGRIEKPVYLYGTESDRLTYSIYNMPTENSKEIFILDAAVTNKLFKATFIKLSLHHSDFLEFIGPLLIAFIAYQITSYKLGHFLGVFLYRAYM